MPSTTNVTLDMMITECQRVLSAIKKHYPGLVENGKMNPWLRDHRYAVHTKLCNLLKEAKANKKTNKPKFMELLKNLPNE